MVKKSSVPNVFPLVIVNLPVDLSIPIPNSIRPSVSKDRIESSALSVPELWMSNRIGAAEPFFNNCSRYEGVVVPIPTLPPVFTYTPSS